jgi:hypothetical protein
MSLRIGDFKVVYAMCVMYVGLYLAFVYHIDHNRIV